MNVNEFKLKSDRKTYRQVLVAVQHMFVEPGLLYVANVADEWFCNTEIMNISIISYFISLK